MPSSTTTIAAARAQWRVADAKVAEADAALKQLWRSYDENGKSPSQEAIDRAQSLRDEANVALEQLRCCLVGMPRPPNR